MKDSVGRLVAALIAGVAVAPAQAHVGDVAHIHGWLAETGWSGVGVVAVLAGVAAIGVWMAIRIARRR